MPPRARAGPARSPGRAAPSSCSPSARRRTARRSPACHVTRRAQVAQLAACGFERVEIVDPDGAFVGADAASSARWFYYIARRGVPAPG